MPEPSMHYVACGHFTSREPWIHPQRSITTYECILVTEGSVLIEENGVHYELRQGDVLLLEPLLSHGGYAISSDRVSFFWLHMSVSEGLPWPRKHFSLRELYPAVLLFRQLLHYSTQSYPQRVCDALLLVLSEELNRQSLPQDNPATPLAIRVREWIRINSDKHLDLSKVSDHFGYNADYLSRLIRRNYGCSLKELIAEYRTKEIKKQLLTTDLTLAQIASATGFENYKQFLKFFRYHEGMTPTEYRAIYYSTHTNNR